MRSKNGSLFYRFILAFARLFFRIFYRLRVYGIENFEKGGAFIAANHSSFFDPPLIAITAPEEVHFLGKGGLFNKKWFAKIISSLNTHPLKGSTKDLKTFKLIQALLEKEYKVVIFPEGTRGDSEDIAPLKRGLSLMVSRANAKIMPVYIAGTFKAWNRKMKFPSFGHQLAVVYGKAIYWDEFAHLDPKEVDRALLSRIQHSLEELKEWYETDKKSSPP